VQYLRRWDRLKRQLSTLEFKLLHAQLNPHFIFNALNNIYSEILKEHNKTAAKYLVDFSRLMRLIFESSSEEFVGIDQEIEMLRLYVNMERSRFDKPFDVEWYIVPPLPEVDYQIPSLIFQPVIENAINHGLLHRKTPGTLKISMEIEDGYLRAEVEDNGLGRKGALSYSKSLAKEQHKSGGTRLIIDRIEKTGELLDMTQSKVVIDDIGPNPGYSGTKVSMTIPLVKAGQSKQSRKEQTIEPQNENIKNDNGGSSR
jgi:LytS/YehU family sensor histidine kinase